jgi:hypothetical protein
MLVLQALDGDATRFERIGIAETAMYDEYDPMLGFAPPSKFFERYWEEDREFSLL